ncbi:protein of unknown function [Burkholderia multivorans]
MICHTASRPCMRRKHNDMARICFPDCLPAPQKGRNYPANVGVASNHKAISPSHSKGLSHARHPARIRLPHCFL